MASEKGKRTREMLEITGELGTIQKRVKARREWELDRTCRLDMLMEAYELFKDRIESNEDPQDSFSLVTRRYRELLDSLEKGKDLTRTLIITKKASDEEINAEIAAIYLDCQHELELWNGYRQKCAETENNYTDVDSDIKLEKEAPEEGRGKRKVTTLRIREAVSKIQSLPREGVEELNQ